MRYCLVVDDSSVIRKVARRILEDLDFTVNEAADGQQALDYCRRQMPDVILLDWSLPVMSGVDFLVALRKEEDGKHAKVVFCAAENDVGQIARAMRAGADEYLLKPFDREIMEAKLQEVGAL
jgi:two-component system chemotaxis response regulator CheY